MKTYLSFFKLRFNIALQYRFASIAGVATQFFWGAMLIMIYEAYYRAGISTPMEWSSLITYVWLGQAFFLLTRFNLSDSDISNSIVTGSVSYELTRPLNLYWIWFSKLLANKMAGTILRFIPIVTIATILPSAYSLGPAESITAFLLFIVTLFLGVILNIGIAMLIYVMMFYTTSSKGLFNVYAVIADFLSGSVLPIPFMPSVLRTICYILPFRLAFDLPFRLYVGNISAQEGLMSIGIQLFWIVAIIIVGEYLLNRSIKRVVVQGG